ncbi:TraB/GumN family protein [Pseudoxanthomonas winnipegensis]|uniref:TraB/GumN family protein n=1 Tax=Pseudoxanthomonas winnipegensis TaxID=2480810 RepID=UPI001F479913|nr:TraB/GumN family protein [Pseudoxanthomonas winnipegensis]
MRKLRLSLVAPLLLVALSASAQQATPPPASEPAITDLAPMTVSGVQPGPGLWKVSRDGHVLWVLGTLTPLPKRMDWRSTQVESAIAGSQELLLPPSMSLDTGRGMFGNLFLLPSLFKAAKNPDSQTLQEVVPASEYARWSALKARYLGRDRGVEQRRPIFAALELYKAAMKDAALSTDNVVAERVQTLAKRAGLKVTSVVATARLDDPKAAIREFQRTGLDDRSCFSRTLDVLEHEIDAMRAQANAWAVGDIDTLRIAPQATQYGVCQAAISESGLARKLGLSTLRQQSLDLWLEKAQAALAQHQGTVALLPMGLILGRNNLIDALKARGYTVEAPDAE